MNYLSTVAKLRQELNMQFGSSIRELRRPDELLILAKKLGDPVAIGECQVLVGLELEAAGRPVAALKAIEHAKELVDDGVQFSFPWAWRYLNTLGNLADDFGQLSESVEWHQRAKELADKDGRMGFPTVSRTNLGYVSIQLGLLSEALGFLSEAAIAPGMPVEYRMGVNLMVAGVLSQRQQFEQADAHIEIALGFPIEVSEISDKRMLRTFAMVAMDLDDVTWASSHAGSLRRFVDSSGSDLCRLESLLFEAKLDRASGSAGVAEARLREVVARCSPELGLRATAQVSLAAILAERGCFVESLAMLDGSNLDIAAAAVVISALRSRRKCLEELGRWRDAAGLFEEIEQKLSQRAQDVTVLYELEKARSHSISVAAQNEALRAKNARLEVLARDQELILETVANKLQSPLTSLQLALETLQVESFTGSSVRWFEIALASIHRIDALAFQLSLAGEVDSGGIKPSDVEFDVGDLLDEVLAVSAPGLRVALALSDEARFGASPKRSVGDPVRLGQVLGALLWGVAESSPADSVIGLSSSSDGDGRLQIVVDVPGLDSLTTRRLLEHRKLTSDLQYLEKQPGSDLSFYLAERLASLIGLSMVFLDKQFVLSLPESPVVSVQLGVAAGGPA